MFRAVIFDLDGTLITLQVDGVQLRESAAELFEKNGFEMGPITGEKTVQGMIDVARAQAERWPPDTRRVEFQDIRDEIYHLLDSLEMQWIKDARPVPGVSEVLRGLPRPPLTVATLTNSGRPATEYAMEKFGFRGYIDRVFTRDDLPSMKPSPRGLLYAVGSMKVAPSEVIYIGDSVIDITAARGARLPVASVPTGRYDYETLLAYKPDYMLRSLSEVLTVVLRDSPPVGSAWASG